MPSPTFLSSHRRTTAAALKLQILAFLTESLPEGWLSQPLAPGPAAGGRAAVSVAPRTGGGAGASPDILVISPRGRCHFLFVRAPADRWWDGGLRSVPAEAFAAADAAMARRLRAAGHKARAIWSEHDLRRALRTWGCPIKPPRRTKPKEAAPGAAPQSGAGTARPTLHLGMGRGRTHG